MTFVPEIIVADDDSAIRLVVGEALRHEGWNVIEAENILELRDHVNSGRGHVVITDVIMPGGNGLEELTRLAVDRPDLPFLVMSAQNTLSTAMEASKRGAMDYIPKPFDINELVDLVKVALSKNSIDDTVIPVPLEEGESLIIGRSPAMQEVYRIMARVVGTDLTVLIEGESGTGKELVAREMHQHSKRKSNPFVAVNMAAVPKELIESELFGHERGAFTGALQRSMGRFGQARGGTLFLDEIGDMPLDAQTRLLRVLQEGEYHSVGGQALQKADVRVIAATNKDLGLLVKEGKFREDLYFRLNVVPIQVPPLRSRLEDISSLVKHFLAKASSEGVSNKSIGDKALALFQTYSWPGNVRELENMVQRLCVLYAEDRLTPAIVKREFDARSEKNSIHVDDITSAKVVNYNEEGLRETVSRHLDRYFAAHDSGFPPNGIYQRILHEIEIPLLEKTLGLADGNQVKTAELLGLNRNTLRKKLNEHGIVVMKSGNSKNK